MYRRAAAFALALTLAAACPMCAQDPNQPRASPPSSGNRLSGLIGPRQFSNVPDDVGYQLNESDETIDAWFPYGPLKPLHTLWERSTRHLKDTTGLDLGMNYTVVYQHADTSVRGPKGASDGDLDVFGRWNLLGCDGGCPGALVFDAENRHRLSRIPPDDLNTGTVGGTIVGFGVQDFALVQLYWEQGSFEDGLILRVGKMDPGLIYDGGRYVSSNYAFFSPFFSDTVPMALPDAGLGIAGGIYPTNTTYIAAGLHDANGKRTTSGFNTLFDEGEFFTAVEAGWFPNEDERNEGLYHFTFWHIDSRKRARRPSDRGFALTMEQQIGWDYVPFLRYAYADRGLNDIRQNLSVGIGIEDVLCQNYDLIGTAFSWQEPANRTQRDQYVFETFYRIVITPHTHLTPDVQVVIDPARAPNKSSVTIFGLRIRTLY